MKTAEKRGGGESDTGEQADNHGIPEGGGGGHHSLLHAVGGICRSRDDTRGAQAGFIGEQATAHAHLHGQHDGGAQETTGSGLVGKGALPDALKCRQHIICMHGQHQHTADDVDQGHDGHKG